MGKKEWINESVTRVDTFPEILSFQELPGIPENGDILLNLQSVDYLRGLRR